MVCHFHAGSLWPARARELRESLIRFRDDIGVWYKSYPWGTREGIWRFVLGLSTPCTLVITVGPLQRGSGRQSSIRESSRKETIVTLVTTREYVWKHGSSVTGGKK